MGIGQEPGSEDDQAEGKMLKWKLPTAPVGKPGPGPSRCLGPGELSVGVSAGCLWTKASLYPSSNKDTWGTPKHKIWELQPGRVCCVPLCSPESSRRLGSQRNCFFRRFQQATV